MSLDNIVGKPVFYNVRTKTLVAVLDKDAREVAIATVNGDSLGRRRSVRASLFHSEYLASDGQPHGHGYVPVDVLPEGHPHAVKATKTDWSSMNIDDLDALDDAELADLILEQEKIKKEAAELADRAKTVAKSRRGNSLGLDIKGDIALVYTSGSKFDAGYARRGLSPEDYQKILLPKPDATLARRIFENEPEKLEACLKDNGPTLTVRKATEDDLAKFAESQPSEDEDFSYSI